MKRGISSTKKFFEGISMVILGPYQDVIIMCMVVSILGSRMKE